MRVGPIALVGVLVAGALTACAETDCTPTRSTATEAAKVDLTAASNSSVIESHLTVRESNEPIPGRVLRFAVSSDGSELYDTTASTGDDGFARVDLKRVDKDALVAVARGDTFSASFAGDSTYCASSDTAEFRVVKTPLGAAP
ncbi:MAG TPA: hypothetical protein VNB24_04415 [Acidimicrobiales bacterium]|nr:hypothetical protein [Acidimicrobiales bacterium]